MTHQLRAFAATAVALALLAPLAAQADPLADGVAAFKAQNYPVAVRLLTPLAQKGDPAAQFHLGLMRRFGLGVSEDGDAGRELNRQAAIKGYPQARQLMVAECLGDAGDECPQALTWLRADADAGNVEDETALGAMYLLGRGVDPDPVQAVAWFRKAANGGDVRAQVQLGAIYAGGAGDVAADPAQSLAWYRKAADQGDESARRALALVGAAAG
jgi:TPR repeat protein